MQVHKVFIANRIGEKHSMYTKSLGPQRYKPKAHSIYTLKKTAAHAALQKQTSLPPRLPANLN